MMPSSPSSSPSALSAPSSSSPRAPVAANPDMSQPRVKVAVVGSGLAGLTAAYLLNKHPTGKFEVHIFEQAAEIGMDSASVVVPVPVLRGEKVHVQDMHIDVPMRSFQGGYYARLMALYTSLGLRPEVRDFSYSFSYLSPLALLPASTKPDQGRDRLRTKLLHNGANGTRGLGLPSELRVPQLKAFDPEQLFKWTRSTTFNLLTFLSTALWLLVLNIYILFLSFPVFRPQPQTTLREWSDAARPRSALMRSLGAGKRWDMIMDEVVVPLFSAVCTCATEDVWRYPAEEILEYIYLTIGTHHYTVPGGSAAVISRLTSSLPLAQVHLSSPVTSLSRSWKTGQTTLQTPAGAQEGFAHVILATQAHYAAHLLEGLLFSDDADGALRTLQQCALLVPQARAEVVTHTWPGLLPAHAEDQRDLNLVTFSPSPSSASSSQTAEDRTAAAGAAKQPIMATHVVPLPSNAHPSQAQIFQTTNPLPVASLSIPPAHVLSRTVFARAYVDLPSKQAIERELLQVRRTRWGGRELAGPGRAQGRGVWLVGSWVGGGIPLLEGCVQSAELVVDGILRESRPVQLAVDKKLEEEEDEDEELVLPSARCWSAREAVGDWTRDVSERMKIYAWLVQDLAVLGWYRVWMGREERERLKAL
ncbi:FAD/NAD(P)-binding domain-containing protein [Calocera viscosa TUFC12733]|uniref:FAD/NAD(P)-binding domain-containing protein n=1 Tax=Calocera viscosa (strain TUFC12733) TaxID=1330018 RepID=A0A167RJ56_CALVF|nr:FAD/NAD(P)-binding domain-containing protein [Calocera viscosa TUFC12733]